MNSKPLRSKILKLTKQYYRISAQVKDITNVMVIDTKKQGEDLVKIENAVTDAKDNVLKGEDEIRNAEKEDRGNCCKHWWIAIIIVIVIVTVILLIVFIK